MDMGSFEKIMSNCDVLHLIFEHLNLREQMKLTKICQQFEYVIVHSLWPGTYKNLKILEIFPSTILVLPYIDTANYNSLTDKEVNRFLNIFAGYVNKLELEFVEEIKDIICFKYNQLTVLSFGNIILEDRDLQQVAENCLNLQSLRVIRCMNIEREPLQMDRDLQQLQRILQQMKNLNELYIINSKSAKWSFQHVRQLFSIRNLKVLNIDSSYLYGYTSNNVALNSTEIHDAMEQLTIGNFSESQTWQLFLMEDLKRFRNLIKLSIALDIHKFFVIDDNILKILCNDCPLLQDLALAECKLNINEIPFMPNLQQLTLNRCLNLTVSNLKEIFLKLELKSFRLTNTTIKEDILNYYFYSKTLKSLNLATALKCDIIPMFISSQHKFENIFALSLFNDTYKQSEKLYLSPIFPKLQELSMDSFYIAIEDIKNLKYLKILKFNLFDNMSWSYLEILFQHPQLTHITIDLSFRRCNNFEKHYERLPKTCEGLTTTLEYLSIPSVVFERALDFWAQFQLRNKKLKLNKI